MSAFAVPSDSSRSTATQSSGLSTLFRWQMGRCESTITTRTFGLSSRPSRDRTSSAAPQLIRMAVRTSCGGVRVAW